MPKAKKYTLRRDTNTVACVHKYTFTDDTRCSHTRKVKTRHTRTTKAAYEERELIGALVGSRLLLTEAME